MVRHEGGRVKFAYADPPYPGQSKHWYGEHPDYAGEVDHAELIAQLCRDYPDGWALSTNAVSLQYVLAQCPGDVRVAAWVNTSSQPPIASSPGWWWCWEPVIVCGGRWKSAKVRNVLACGTHRQGRFPGGKPPAFCRWVFGLLGAVAGDELDDLFPGSGAVGREWQAFVAQPWLPAMTQEIKRPEPSRQRRRMAAAGVPGLWSDEVSA